MTARTAGQLFQAETIHIKGMDGETTKEDLIEALKDEKVLPEKSKVSELRPYANNTQAATITIPKGDAEKLFKIGFLTVGLVRCTLEKRIKMTRCYNCWSYDHKASECTGPNRTNLCFNCGLENHASKDCSNQEACPICEQAGHKAGTLKCQIFKAALSQARREERSRT